MRGERCPAAVIAMILGIVLGAPEGLPAAQSDHAPDTVGLAAAMPHLLELGDVPGLSIAVVHQGEVVWTGAFGTLGDGAGTPVNHETVFSAASLSKPVFAYVVLRLAERGEIDLDRPLAELLEYPRVTHDARGRMITPRMVLSHGTGLPNWGGERLEFQFEPGTGFNYSGEGFVYLQRVVEQVAGVSLKELARLEVFEPLGMTRTSYVWQDRFEGNAVYGKDWAWRMQHVVRYEEPNAAFSLLTTAGDYARFVAALLGDAGLGEEGLSLMLRPANSARRSSRSTPADDQVSWGLGWGLQEGRAGRAFWHWGDNGRFKAYVVAYPERRTGVVYLANGNDGLSIAEAIVSRVVEDDHRALQWLDYTRHDDPERRISKAVQRAAMDHGEGAAVARYHEIRLEGDARLGVGTSLSVAAFLNEQDFDDARQHVLGVAAQDHPDSIRVHRALAEAHLEVGRYEAALAAQRRALTLTPDDEDERRRVRWIEERIAAREDARPVDPALLERYVGVYGPRRVWLEDGELWYEREGNRAYRLIPMSEEVFALEGLETFRVRFVGAAPDPAVAIEGLYFDGATDRSERAAGRPASAPDPGATPLPVDSGFVTTDDGIRLFYRTVGDGEVDIVIPVALYLEDALSPLAAPDRRLVFYDLRGRGRSGAGDRSLVTLDRQLADLEAVRSGLAIDRMVLVGWSGLGMEMFVYALRHPERVEALIQVAPVAARDEPHNPRAYATRRERMDTAAVAVVRDRHQRGMYADDPVAYCRALHYLTMPVNLADPAFMAGVPDPCEYPNEHPDRLSGLFGALLGSFAGYDWREEAAVMPVRRLVIHGAEDPFPLEGSREWVPPGSNARLLVLDRAGHFPFLERPDGFFPAVEEFLRGGWPEGVEGQADPSPGAARASAPHPGGPGGTLTLLNASVVPMTGDSILRGWTLVLAGGEIVEMGPTSSVPVPADGELHDLAGAYVVPGLIDAHVHLREPAASLALFPATGVTTVVSLQGEPAYLALRDSVLARDLFAPRIFTSGPYIERLVDTADEATAEVRRQHAAGYDLIKIHGDIDEGAFVATVDEARRLGLPVVAHHPRNLSSSTVIDGRLAALTHAEELLRSSFLDGPADLSPDSVTAIARAVTESGTAVVTTLAFFTGMRDQATDRFYDLINRPELAYVSPARRRGWLHDGHREYIDASELPWYDSAVDILHRITGAIHAQGGVVVAGTDTPLEYTIPGFSLHRELDHLLAAGLTPLEALRAATVAPADLLGRPELGRIEVGAAADLLILGADPTASLAALEQVQAVVLRGTWYSRAELDRRLDGVAAAYAREGVALAARERVREGVMALLREEGTAVAFAELRRLSELPGDPLVGERDLNALGYRLLGEGDTGGAIDVFRLNVRLYPASANVYDSLGEAYLAADRLDEAETSYQRALDLDPTMDSARRGLEAIAERRQAPGLP